MALELCNSFESCAKSLGFSPRHLLSTHRRSDADIVDAVAASLQKHDARASTNEVRDAATNFTTNSLAVTLDPVIIKGNTRYLFTPGFSNDPLIPVVTKADMGDRSLEWTSVTLTGEAAHFAPGAIRDLPYVDSADDFSEQGMAYYGVRYRYNRWDLWEGAKLKRNVPAENQEAAARAMANTFEEIGGIGYNSRKIPGFFRHGNAITVDLPLSFGDPAITYEQVLNQLSVLHLMWYTANPNVDPSGVVMPRRHLINLKKIFIGDNKEGGALWLFAESMFPWLRNIIEDDRLLTANDVGGPMWSMWSADALDLFREASDEMVFGPFDDELDTSFVVIRRDSGTICRRSELLWRVQMPAV